MTNPTLSLRILLFTTLGYTLLGAAGLALAIPPGYASPIFPAAGLALACALWFDRRILISIWLGSAGLNLANLWLNGALNPATAVAAAGIATGALMQAWAGVWLVNRWHGPVRNGDKETEDAFGLLLLGGALSCILSASTGVTSLYTSGVIEPGNYLFSWWNWYMGDVLGVLIVTPLALLFLREPRALFEKRHRRDIALLLLFSGLIVMSLYGAGRWEKYNQDRHLNNDSEKITRMITDRLITHREVLASLSHFIEATPDFNFKQFEQFTRITLEDNPDIFAMSFNDLVPDSRRHSFESMMSRLSPLGLYQITERDSERRLIRALTRPEYVAVRYIVPLASNKPAVGFDINSEPIRRDAIKRARASKSMAVTAPIQLVQEQKKRIGILELLPMMKNGNDRSSSVIGFAVTVVKVDEMIDIATKGHVPAGLMFQLNDFKAPDHKGFLYTSAFPGDASGAAVDPASSAQWKTELRMGDRDWTLSIYASPLYRHQHRSWTAWVVGLLGILFIALLQMMTNLWTKLEESVRREMEIYKTLAEQSFTAFFVIQNGVFVYVSRNMANLCAFTVEEFIGMNPETIIFPEDRAKVRASAVDMLKGVQTSPYEYRIVTKDNQIRWMMETVTAINYNGHPSVLGNCIDITEKRQREVLDLHSQKLESVGQLAAGIAHEINTPIQYISDNVHFLRNAFQEIISAMNSGSANRENETQKQTDEQDLMSRTREEAADIDFLKDEIPKAIEQSLEGLQRVSVIVLAMREFSHPGGEYKTALNVNRAIESTVTLTRNEWKYSADLAMSLEPGLPEIQGYPADFNQVILNLIINAAQSIQEKINKNEMEKGRIDISTRLDGDEVEIRIQDSGMGIPQELQSRIFDPFFTTKEVGKGTGQGLAIARNIIVNKHGGKIRVESVAGEGAAFHIRLPLK